MNNNNDNRIVLNPSSITPNIVAPSENTNDRHCITETLIDLQEERSTSIPQSTETNVLVSHESQLHQVVRPLYNESNTSYRNGGAQTELLSRDYDTYPNFRYSPPPPYELIANAGARPAPYQILPFPSHQNAQYLNQQRLQYPQQESLQYHEEFSGYSQQQRMPYSNRREGNLPGLYEPSSTSRYTCNTCLMVDTMCCCFCVLPICLLIFFLYTASFGF